MTAAPLPEPLAPPESRDALRAWIRLRRAVTACTEQLERQLADAGLTESQFGVLEALHHKGPMHPCDLARKILRSTGNLTLVLDQLEQRGLLRRERGAADRRYVTVHLTIEGTALVAELFPLHAADVATLFAVFTPDECRQFGDACRTLGLHAATAPLR